MSRKNDDSIEKFFRKAVRQSDTTFRESDWLAMEKMLDEQAQLQAAARLKFWRRMATGFSGVLLLSVGLYLLIPGENSKLNAVGNSGAIAGDEKSTVHSPQSTGNAGNAVVGSGGIAGDEKSTVDGPQSTGNAGNAVVGSGGIAGDGKSTVDGPQSTGNAIVGSGGTEGNGKSTVDGPQSTGNARNAVVSAGAIAGDEKSTVDGPRSTGNAGNAVVGSGGIEGNEKSTVDGPQSTGNAGNAVVSAGAIAGDEKSTVDGPRSTGNAGNAVVGSGGIEGNGKSTVDGRRSTENAGNAGNTVIGSGGIAGDGKSTVDGPPSTENAERRSTAGNTKPTVAIPNAADKNARSVIGNAVQKDSQGVRRDASSEQADATLAQATTAGNKRDQNITATPVAPVPAVAGAVVQRNSASNLDGAEQRNTTAMPSGASKASAAADAQRPMVAATEKNGSTRDDGATLNDATHAPVSSERQPAATAASDIPTQQQKQPPAVGDRSSSGNRQSTIDSLRASNREQPAVGPFRTVDSLSAFSVDRGRSTVDPAQPVDSTLTAPATHTEQADSRSQQPTRIPTRWSAALVLAPDFSSTGIGSEMTAPGQAFGGMIGYRLSKRFTITSGVLKSAKKYVGYGSDYTPPEGYWQRRTNGVVPDEIVGRCTIIEVPLLVQFDLRQGKRSRLYLSGGISSYLMRHESYDYNFDAPNEGADRGWSSSEPSSFLFKVGHVSAAYELMVMPSLGVGIEPFIKIPFQGIGWANISLYTTGAYVNVRYYLLKKNK